MRKVLLLSPHFVPSDLPDMQRLRVCVGHFQGQGWEPHILCVDHRSVGREIDSKLSQTIPQDLRVTRVGALPRLPGMGAIGIRSFASLAIAGKRLLESERFDLVVVSTTAFPVMALAARWARKFNVPFMLDFQDPWGIYPPEAVRFLRKDIKSRMMHRFHLWLERWTVTRANGLISVNQRYIDTLQDYYGVSVPSLVQPFPYADRDFEVARQQCIPRQTESDGSIRCVCLGRIPDSMRSQLALLMSLLPSELNADKSASFSIRFIGTIYESSGASCINAMATEYALLDTVTESANRISYLESLAEMQLADVLLLLGSSDTSYLPSKVTPYLASGKPILLIADGASLLYRQIASLPGVLAIDSAQAPGAGFDVLEGIRGLTRQLDYGARNALESKNAAMQLTQLFDQVCHD